MAIIASRCIAHPMHNNWEIRFGLWSASLGFRFSYIPDASHHGEVSPESDSGAGSEMNSQIMKDMLAGRADRSVAASERGSSIESGLRDSSGDGTGGFDTRPGQIPASEYNRDPRFKKHEFWIQAKLASKPPAEGK